MEFYGWLCASRFSVSSLYTVLILFFCLIGLISLLIFLYKKLNREANGEYTVRRLVYKEGGIRDRVRGTALALGTRDTSDDNSSLEGSEAGGQARPTDQEEAKGDTEEKVGDEEGKGEASGGAGLLIDLKPFSGSAIWSEEEGGEGKDSDMTAL
uniref:Si:ch211-119e14.1 n=1 Tax=Sander lucioperca TaxID=283035 RepID=A0A8C9XK53_SANLU